MKTVLGIDPGTRALGFGVMVVKQGGISLVDYGVIELSAKLSLADRLLIIHDELEKKIAQWSVTEIALETPFLGKNAQNFLKLGYVRGIIYLLSSRYTLALIEFSPRQIKQALTGFGGADKEQVARVVLRLFPGLTAPSRYDLTDAIAVTVCAVWR